MGMDRAYVYIDGFNLYYGSVKGTPFRWLDVAQMCRKLLPRANILAFKYFTAIVGARPGDPGKPVRQNAYLRALRSIPNLEVILGRFLTHTVTLPLARPRPREGRFASVLRTEEKGSDVNLACHLLNDAYLDRYDLAVLVTNDSDLLEAIRIVTTQMKRKVGILNPQRTASRVLARHASFVKRIRRGVLRDSQFPVEFTDRIGIIRKPAGW